MPLQTVKPLTVVDDLANFIHGCVNVKIGLLCRSIVAFLFRAWYFTGWYFENAIISFCRSQ